MMYGKYISETTKEMKPSGIREFFDIVNTMDDAISLGVGEPDFVTPWSVRDAAIKSIQRGYTQYTSNAGIPELRRLISKYLQVRYGLEYNPENEVVVTVGASEGIDLAMRMLLNFGDEVLVPEPSYVSYFPCVSLSGGVAVPIKCDNEHEFKLQASELEKMITPKTKAIILPYPNNPTGAILEKPFLEEIAKVVKKHDLIVVSDEIYSELTYGSKHVSIASLEGMRERTIVINGFSKAFAMTGWRLGYVCAPHEFAEQILKLHQYVIMCAPTASQFAGIHALKEGLANNFSSVEYMREEYNSRRLFVHEQLNDMGLDCFMPQGAFYAFPSVLKTGMNGDVFAHKLLDEQKVAVVPGIAFGSCGENHVRISYAYSIRNLTMAFEKMREFLGK